MGASRSVVAGVLFAGALVRLVACLWLVPAWEGAHRIASFPDGYPDLARSLLAHGTLSYDPTDGSPPATTRGPAFPAWMAVAVALAPRTPAVWRIWASLPGLLAAAWLAALVHGRAGPGAAWIVGLLAACHPLPVIVSARGMSDEFVGAFSLAAVVLAGWLLERRVSRPVPVAAGCAVASAAVVLARATGLLLLFCLVLMAWRRKTAPSGARRTLLVALALPVAAAAAWSIRSSALEGRPVVIHSLAGYNYWIGESHFVHGVGEDYGTTWRRDIETLRNAAGAAGAGIDWQKFHYSHPAPRQLARLERAWLASAWRNVRTRPLAHIRRALGGLADFWIGADTISRRRHYLLVVAPVGLLAWLGILRLAFSGRPLAPLDLGFAALLLLTQIAYALTFPTARMAVQVWPAACWLVSLIFASPTNTPPEEPPDSH